MKLTRVFKLTRERRELRLAANPPPEPHTCPNCGYDLSQPATHPAIPPRTRPKKP